MVNLHFSGFGEFITGFSPDTFEMGAEVLVQYYFFNIMKLCNKNDAWNVLLPTSGYSGAVSHNYEVFCRVRRKIFPTIHFVTSVLFKQDFEVPLASLQCREERKWGTNVQSAFHIPLKHKTFH